MFSKLTSVSLLITAVAAQAGKFFVQDTGAALVIDRVDPVLLPGIVPGNHVHSIVGPNTFHAGVTYEELQQANCSTAFIKQDKSVYWLPSLYFQDPKNGSLRRVPERPEHKIYYLNRIGQNETMNEFPKDFRMIAGKAELRSKPVSKRDQGITEWNCHDPNLSEPGFPTGFTQCGYGFAGSIHFPHCWNGQPFDINNPTDHVSYPMGDHPDGGYCPPSHPKAMPHIFIEFWFNIKSFNGLYGANDNPWVLSHGDPTGYGFHADFINGWEVGVLKNAMETCTIGESGRPLSECFDVYTPDERRACKIQAQVQEDYDGWVDKLPGCNPIQAGPDAAASTPVCDAAGKVVDVALGGAAKATAVPVVASASKAAAAASSVVSKAGSAASSAASRAGSVASAVGSKVSSAVSPVKAAAASSAKETSAATSAATAPSPADDNDDNNDDANDDNDNGDDNDTPIYTPKDDDKPKPQTPRPAGRPNIDLAKPPSKAATTFPNANVRIPSNWTSAGCYIDAIDPIRSLSGIKLANLGAEYEAGMTSSGCVAYCLGRGFSIAGTEYGTQCFCGNELKMSQKVDEGVCDMPCLGEKGEVCGGAKALSIFHARGVDLSSGGEGAGVNGTVARVKRVKCRALDGK